MNYKLIKRLRVAVSLVFLAVLTVAVLDSAFALTPFGRWIMQDMQLVPAILAGAAMWVLVWVLVTLSVGRVYCSSVCPLGTLQDCAARLGQIIRRSPAVYRYAPPANALRIPIPIIVGICVLAGVSVVASLTDPSTVYRRIVTSIARPMAAGFGSLAVAIIILLAISALSIARGRIICNTVCPTGGLLALLSRGPIFRIDIDTDKCIHCRLCEQVCKAQCIDMTDHVVDNSRCVMCFNCTAICPNEAIILRKGRHQLSIPMMQRTGSMTMQQPAEETVAPINENSENDRIK